MTLPSRNIPYFVKQLSISVAMDATVANRCIMFSLFYGTAVGAFMQCIFSGTPIVALESGLFFAGAASGDSVWLPGNGGRGSLPEEGYYVPPQALLRVSLINGAVGDQLQAGAMLYRDVLDDPMFPAPFESHRKSRGSGAEFFDYSKSG